MHPKLAMLDVHAEGEIGRVVIAGAPPIPGATMLDKLDYVNNVDDRLRRHLCFEPRGFAQTSANLVMRPTRADADAAFLVLQADRAHAMSGSNAISVTTALLETGRAVMREPISLLRLDTPAGLIEARAHCAGGKCEQVVLSMPPSFIYALDRKIRVAGLGEVRFDIAFGGEFVALVDPLQFALPIEPRSARPLAEIAVKLHQAIDQSFEIRHPSAAKLRGLDLVTFVSRDEGGDLSAASVLPFGRVLRSPGGTGSSARLAAMWSRGEAEIGDRFTVRSIIGSSFSIELTGASSVVGRPAVSTEIAGRGWVFGSTTYQAHPSDPFAGQALGDCWSEALDAYM